MNSNFLSFIKKESLHILRDVRTMMLVLLMPIVLMIVFGFAISTEVNNLNVAIVAPNYSDGVRQAVDRLSYNPYFTITENITNDDIDKTLRSGQADAVVVFDEDYDHLLAQREQGIDTQPAVQFIFDASNTNVAQTGATYLQNVIAADHTQQELLNMHLLYNPQMKSAYNFVPGIMGLIFILICSMMTSVAIVREKEVGTMEVLLVSPVRPTKIIFAKMIPYFIISCINLATILLIAKYMLDIPMSGGMGGIIIVSLIYLILSLSLGLLVSTMSSSQAIALLISAMVMMLPMMLLSGMVFPIENLPSVLQPLPYIIPARWYIDAIRKLMIMGLPLSAAMKEIIILSSMAIVFMGIALKKFKDKLE
ncbi:MAG: ABC transporter permease [Bacteroidaceae bacterium]|nr:ABC transporter permease [Bacteroidaceae bacterium]